MWILLVFVVIIVVAGVAGSVRRKNLVEEGKIIERDWNFHEKETWFITSVPWEKVLEAVKKTDFSNANVTVHPYDNGIWAVLFKSMHWSSQLKYKGQRDGKNVYTYALKAWQTRNGSPLGGHTINMMQTAIEKMFLSLDQTTAVETHKMQIKTR